MTPAMIANEPLKNHLTRSGFVELGKNFSFTRCKLRIFAKFAYDSFTVDVFQRFPKGENNKWILLKREAKNGSYLFMVT